MAFANANANSPSGAKYVVEASWKVAKMMQTVQDPTWHLWFNKTIKAWQNYVKVATPQGKDNPANLPPYVDYAAEADFTLVDEQVHAGYDLPESKFKYSGAVNDIVGGVDAQGHTLPKGQYQKNVDLADKWDKELDRIVKTYPSLQWIPAAEARRGNIYDTLRTSLYVVVPPALKYFTPKEDAFLKSLDKADQVRTAKKEFWRSKKDQELAGADEIMVRHYALAMVIARQYNVRNTWTQKAVSRLAYFTDIIGDDKLATYVTKTTNFTNGEKLQYSPGDFVKGRPGLVGTPAPNGEAIPLPAAP
jgi:hypothetical protein